MWLYIMLMGLGGAAYAPIYWAATPALRRYIGPSFALSFAILIFAGLFAPPNLFYLLCIAVMVVLTRGRLDAVCRFILLGALIPSTQTPLVVGGTYLIFFSTLDVLGVGLLLAVMLKPARSREGKLRGFTVEDVIALLFFTANYVAAIRLSDGSTGLMRQMVTGSLTFLLPYFLIRRQLRTIDEFRVVVGCLATAAAILSAFALYEAVHGWSMFVTINEHLGEANVGYRNTMIRGGSMRASTSMQNALMLGCYLAVGWVAMACSRKLVRTRLLWIAGCALVLCGELATQSRGSLVCVVLAVAVLLAAHRRKTLALASLAAGGGGALALFAAAQFSPRIAGLLNIDPDRQAGEDIDYRQVLLHRGLEEAAKHRWTGADIKSVLLRLDDIRQGEGIVDFVNSYLFIYLVMGLLAIVPLTLAIIWLLRNTIAAFKAGDDDGVVAVRAFALAGMIVILVQFAFMSFIDRMPALFALTLAGTRLFVLRQKRGQAIARRKSSRPTFEPRGHARPLTG